MQEVTFRSSIRTMQISNLLRNLNSIAFLI